MQTRKMPIQGMEVQLEGRGSRTVLMLHGWPDTLDVWDGTVKALQNQYRCVRMTLPGFGPGQAEPPVVPRLDDVVDALVAVIQTVSPGAPVTLMLHDWGCIFGYELAMRHPQRVEAVVAVDIGDHNAGAYLQSLTGRQKMAIAGYQLWLAQAWWVGRYVHAGLANRMTRWMSRVMRCPVTPDKLSWTMNFPYAMRWLGIRGGLSTQPVRLDCPVLYVYGERKPFMFHSPRWLHTLRASEEGAAHGLRCGHWVMLEQPEAFHALVLRWLAGRERRKVNRA
ncbi:alpha/beta hydrolase [Rhodoferax sp.]|uniref:alpha/beta fold hydrolase n=1 Tax=Rhodoferax sp. TaxID=50421 RepID=UPI0025DA5DFA|nr:alpha/beta hydrolase [Rhodoferax sp.]